MSKKSYKRNQNRLYREMSMEKLNWFSAYDAITIEDRKIIRTLIVPKKKKEEESKNEKEQEGRK